MENAKQQNTSSGELCTVPLRDNTATSLVRTTLALLATALDAAIFVKEPGDDLLAWPPETVIAATPTIGAVCAFPLPLEIRRRPPPQDHFELCLPNLVLAAGYALMLEARGIPFPGPIPPGDLPAAVRRLFRESRPRWSAVIPRHWGEAATAGGRAVN
jgi:hypothetical protein